MFKLQQGDKVGIISPSAGLEGKDISAALAYLQSQGLQPVLGEHINAQYHYMGGTDSERAQDIMTFFANSEIKAIFCTRGGAGSLRILPHLDYQIIAQNPKPIFGFSDSTALQNGVYAQTGNVSYSGLLLIYDFRDGELNPMQAQDLHHVFNAVKCEYHSGETVIGGKAEGVLVGGNIYAFMSLCGTPYFPDLSGKILLLEDVGIKSYQLDIMLRQLQMQKGFTQIKGIVFGQYADIRIVDDCDGTIDDNINYFCQNLNVPIIKNFAYGHVPARHIMPIGLSVRLDAENCLVCF